MTPESNSDALQTLAKAQNLILTDCGPCNGLSIFQKASNETSSRV